MARLEPLVRFRKHGVDEKRRVLAGLYRDADTLQRRRDELLMQLAREQAIAEAAQELETRAYFGRYAEGVRMQIEAIDAAMAKLNVRIALAQDDVREAFSEMKKIEITARERKRAEDRARTDKESRELDEMALTQYARTQNGEKPRNSEEIEEE